MPSWLPKLLTRIHGFAASGRVRLTLKAEQEAFALGFAPEDVRDVVVALSAEDSAGRIVSRRPASGCTYSSLWSEDEGST